VARIVLHAGLHKTGSTAIQGFFCRWRRAFAPFGLAYHRPRGADGRLRPKAADLFEAVAHEKDHGGAPHPHWGPAAARIAALAAAADRARVTVASAEGLSGPDPAFARAFAPLAGRITVVLVLRRPDRWAESHYRQMVLSREVREARTFADWLADPATEAHLDRDSLLGWWADAVGETALRVFAWPGPAPVLPPFLAEAGLPAALARLPGGRARSNAAPHPGHVETLRRLNAEGRGPDRIDRQRLAPAGPVPGYLDPEARARLLGRHAASHARIAARFGAAATAWAEGPDPPLWDGAALPLP
jgi:hypothetical protein